MLSNDKLILSKQLAGRSQTVTNNGLAGLINWTNSRLSIHHFHDQEGLGADVLSIQQFHAVRGGKDLGQMRRLVHRVPEHARRGGMQRGFRLFDPDHRDWVAR